jgi:hypothetical protein
VQLTAGSSSGVGHHCVPHPGRFNKSVQDRSVWRTVCPRHGAVVNTSRECQAQLGQMLVVQPEKAGTFLMSRRGFMGICTIEALTSVLEHVDHIERSNFVSSPLYWQRHIVTMFAGTCNYFHREAYANTPILRHAS